MTMRQFLRDRIEFILVNVFLFIAVAIVLLLVKINPNLLIFIAMIWFGPIISYFIVEFMRTKTYLGGLQKIMDELDKKYLLPEMIEKPDFAEGRIIHEILSEASKDMHEQVKHHRKIQEDYREYIETWVHEIKTPIASIGLIIKNDSNMTTHKIAYESKRIENYIEQVLYYSRSNNVSQDYIIKEFFLKNSLMKVIKGYSTDFIRRKIVLDLGELETNVYSDIKWVEFILGQVISNAIKYSNSEGAILKIYSTSNQYNVVLTVEDNGVGISDKDISRVFEKGFTGENGRKFGRSTGIGLYLCKKLCDKLGLGISLTSKEGVGTKVNIIFPIGS
ncbi:MAG: sensor histidine kinase [Cellulosilyticaceae bacterium]